MRSKKHEPFASEEKSRQKRKGVRKRTPFLFYGGEEGRTPVREGKPGTSTGLVMRGGCREPVAA